jgi:hypothetical protein
MDELFLIPLLLSTPRNPVKNLIPRRAEEYFAACLDNLLFNLSL